MKKTRSSAIYIPHTYIWYLVYLVILVVSTLSILSITRDSHCIILLTVKLCHLVFSSAIQHLDSLKTSLKSLRLRNLLDQSAFAY